MATAAKLVSHKCRALVKIFRGTEPLSLRRLARIWKLAAMQYNGLGICLTLWTEGHLYDKFSCVGMCEQIALNVCRAWNPKRKSTGTHGIR